MFVQVSLKSDQVQRGLARVKKVLYLISGPKRQAIMSL